MIQRFLKKFTKTKNSNIPTGLNFNGFRLIASYLTAQMIEYKPGFRVGAD